MLGRPGRRRTGRPGRRRGVACAISSTGSDRAGEIARRFQNTMRTYDQAVDRDQDPMHEPSKVREWMRLAEDLGKQSISEGRRGVSRRAHSGRDRAHASILVTSSKPTAPGMLPPRAPPGLRRGSRSTGCPTGADQHSDHHRFPIEDAVAAFRLAQDKSKGVFRVVGGPS
jgi:hypothetical protein